MVNSKNYQQTSTILIHVLPWCFHQIKVFDKEGVLEGRIMAGRIDNKSEWKNYQNVTNRFSGNAEKKVAIWSGTKTSGNNRDKNRAKGKKKTQRGVKEGETLIQQSICM